MKTLIISDIHLRHHLVEDIIDSVEHDQIVFTGDYFDNFNDSPIQNQEAAEWLKISLREPNRIHLMGNHDMHYWNKSYRCSGFSSEKAYAINKVLHSGDWADVKFYHTIDNWLLTHAGLTYPIFKKLKAFHHVSANLVNNNIEKVKEILDEAIADFYVRPNVHHNLIGAGMHRGGFNAFGGITWCDIDEFHPLANVNQVFGHTCYKEPTLIASPKTSFGKNIKYNVSEHPEKVYSYNYCIDNFNKTYAILENNKLSIFDRRTQEELT